MHRIITAAINWYAKRDAGEKPKGDLERAIIEAIEAARAAHIHIRDITLQQESC